jgi:predicted metal-binding protein
MAKKIEKITVDMNAGRLQEDLEKYRTMALKMGATQAAVIKTADIPVDERVTLKCRIPRCFGYGVGAHCPPNTLKPEELREILKKFQFAVFFIKEVPAEVIVRDKATIKERVAAYQEVYKIVNDLESLAFHDGHYLAFGFGAGSCRHTFCGQMESCQAMEGKKCRFSLRSRPSMEAVGIDVYKMVARAGWDIYPIGSDDKPEDIPKGTLAGLLIVQ